MNQTKLIEIMNRLRLNLAQRQLVWLVQRKYGYLEALMTATSFLKKVR